MNNKIVVDSIKKQLNLIAKKLSWHRNRILQRQNRIDQLKAEFDALTHLLVVVQDDRSEASQILNREFKGEGEN